jgi:hypothetical protein
MTKPPHVRRALQAEITAVCTRRHESVWFSTFAVWVRALGEVVGVEPAGVAVTDVRFLAEMYGIKHLGSKILHLEAPDAQAGLTPEQRAHRSETELDSHEVLELRRAHP